MATLFKGLLSIEMLAEMPLPFVHILRDQRIKQLEAKRRQSEIMASKMPNPQSYLNNNNQQPASHPEAGPAFDESAIEEIVEGLT
jgi:hypothetical protein